MLIDQRRTGTIVAHPVHQVTQTRAGRGGVRVPGKPQVMKCRPGAPTASTVADHMTARRKLLRRSTADTHRRSCSVPVTAHTRFLT